MKKSRFSISRQRLLNVTGPFAAGVCAVFIVLLNTLFISWRGLPFEFDEEAYILRHFVLSVPFSLAFLLNVPMRFGRDRRQKKFMVKHLTFLFILLHGVVGTCAMLVTLPPDINAGPAYFWFTYGLVCFFLGGATFADLLLYGAVYFVITLYYMSAYGEFTLHEKFTLLFMLFQLVHFTPVSLLAARRIQAIRHAFKQLEKVFYPHQIRMIRRAKELEQTMPTAAGEACVICFDVVGSTQIQHTGLKDFLRKVFARCNSIMMEEYNGIDLVARGYRIKEMGDGFLCSVGYPFRSRGDSVAKDALDLALAFHEAFRLEAAALQYDRPVLCGIGIAYDSLSGFYPESGTKEYDLHGRAIALATRYEAMRKQLFPDGLPESVMILQERVWSSLKAKERDMFVKVALDGVTLSVRDDTNARTLYYQLLDANAGLRLSNAAG